MINKASGAPITFSWTYDVADEASISGFDIVLEAKGSNPTETIIATLPPSSRSTTGLLAPTLGGQYFYVSRAFLDDPGGKISSADSDEAEVNVVVLPIPGDFSVA